MINIVNLSKSFGSKIIFESLTVALNEQHRIGIIGANGTGKTTFLRMIAGTETPDSGLIEMPAEITIGFLPQEIETLENKSPLEIVLEPYEHLINYEKRIVSLAEALEKAEVDHREIFRCLDDYQAQVESHSAFSLPSRAKAILSGLGVPQLNWELPVKTLSGGFRMRVVLAKLLLMSPQLLLLDEPTNHLDMDSLIWLEKFLSRAKCGMLIVSHDRQFLNRITTHIAEITNRTINIYEGNYDSFVEQKKIQEKTTINKAKNLERIISQNVRFIDRFRAKNTKATLVQSRVKLVEELKAQMPILPKDEKTIRFKFPSPSPSGLVCVKAEGLSVSYDSIPVFTDLSFTITRGEKIAVIGPNGAGKSTLIKTIAGLIKPCAGVLTLGHNIQVCYFGQHQLEQLDLQSSIYDTIVHFSGINEKSFVQGLLGTFLFSGDDVYKKIGVLSGGEKARCVLAMIMSRPANLLLLDEPTNHLDMRSVEVLTNALEEFEGTVLMVSHNEYFISRIANRIIEMRPGLFRDFPGSIDDYRNYVEMLFSADQTIRCSTTKQVLGEDKQLLEKKRKRIENREFKKQLCRKIERLEKLIHEKETELSIRQSIINKPSNASKYELLHENLEAIKRLKEETEEMIFQWEDLHQQLQQAEQDI